MYEYTVYLFRSGRVWISGGFEDNGPLPTTAGDPPLLTAQVTANSEIAALGKLLLQYVDRARQPYQHIPICVEWCCTYPCGECGRPLSVHSLTEVATHHSLPAAPNS